MVPSLTDSSAAKKTYVLDTNVFLYDPRALFVFKEHHVVIPIVVLEELDRFKKDLNETGRNARHFSRYLDGLRKQGSLASGVELPGGGTVRVTLLQEGPQLPPGFGPLTNDNLILGLCKRLHDADEGPVILVTRDTNMRIKGDALGIRAEDYLNAHIDVDERYSGVDERDVDAADIDRIYDGEGGWIAWPPEPDLDAVAGAESEPFPVPPLNPNQFLILSDPSRCTAMVRYDAQRQQLRRVGRRKESVWGIRPRNKEQLFALELLLDDRIRLVTLDGMAGTGKTLLAVAAGLSKVADDQEYRRLLVARPIFPMGKDLGFLPGDVNEKLNPWMKPIFDNLEMLLSSDPSSTDRRRGGGPIYQPLLDQGILKVEPLTYIRGRSLPGQYIIIDECFPGDQHVLTSEGKRKIGPLYRRWARGDAMPTVRTFNETTRRFEDKRITHMWERGTRSLVTMRCANRKIRCTPNHRFLSAERGWLPVSELKIGELLITSDHKAHQMLHALNADQQQILLGSFLGDGHISLHGQSRCRLRIRHGGAQSAYCAWKGEMFGVEMQRLKAAVGFSKVPGVTVCTQMIGTSLSFPKSKTTCPRAILELLDTRALAIWFMDDGSVNGADYGYNSAQIHTESFDGISQLWIAHTLREMGVACRVGAYNRKDGRRFCYIRLNKAGYRTLSRMIAPYVHPSMAYKIHPDDRHLIGTYVWDAEYPEHGLTVVDAIDDLGEAEVVYDMEVEDNHNFLVCSSGRGVTRCDSGILAHNCQNLTPHEVKTVLTRVGEGTKIVLTGDPNQIDNPYVDATSNGLTYVVERFKDSPLAGHVTLTKGERSELAKQAAERL